MLFNHLKKLILFLPLFSITATAQTVKKEPKKQSKTQQDQEAEPYVMDSTFYKAFFLGEAGNPSQSTIHSDTQSKKFPNRNPSLLASLPQLHSDQDVLTYLQRIKNLIAAKQPASKITAVKNAMAGLKGAIDPLNNAAVVSWQNGANAEALLLATEACLQKPNDALALNNLSALLNLAGGESKSIPLLQKLARDFPKSSMILNNLGQAYTGIGELDTAMVYFARCLQESPNHPEANNTAGQIEASRGNTEKAHQHFERAIKVVTTEATLKEMERQPTAPWTQYLRPRVNIPYFNPYAGKYEILPQIESIDQVDALSVKYQALSNFLFRTQDLYMHLSNTEGDKHRAAEAQKQATFMANLQKGRIMDDFAKPPFAVMASRKMVALKNAYDDREAHLYLYIQKRESEIEKHKEILQEKRIAIFDACKTEACRCPKLDAAATDYLKAVAPIRRDIQKKQLQLAREKYENMSYYGFLSGSDTPDARQKFYDACVDYLQALMQANKTESQTPCAQLNAIDISETALDAAITPPCPINLKVNIKVGELELTCNKFKINAFGGVLKGSKDADTKQYTLALGVELKGELGKEMGIVKGTVGVSAEETFYLTFDENNKLVDAGLAFEVGLSAEAGLNLSKGQKDENGALSRAETMEEYQNAIKKLLKTGNDDIYHGGVDQIQKLETSFGYTLGVNSGWTFNEGGLGTLSKVLAGEMPPAGPLKQFGQKK